MELPDSIFKSYDIRGVVDRELTDELVYLLGRSFGSFAAEAGQHTVWIGRDGRLSGERFLAAFAQGVCDCGLSVMDLGCVPTPLAYFAGASSEQNNVVSVTGSHNPPEYNGFKMVLDGVTLSGSAIQALKHCIAEARFQSGNGSLKSFNCRELYQSAVCQDVKLSRPLHVVIDAGNGVAGAIAPGLYRALGCKVEPLYCEVDGLFPNHHPDPSKPENLQDLIHRVAQVDADLGLAFDGDGDRLGVVTRAAEVIYPDRQMMLFSEDVLKNHPGSEIIFDVKCSRYLARWIEQKGGQPVIWKTGHSLIKAKLKELSAPLAGEMSGHIFFNDRWYGFDDALYTGARLLGLLSEYTDVSSAFKRLPDSVCTPELHMQMSEGEPHRLIETLTACVARASFPKSQQILYVDGLRVEYSNGFGLIRASNTTPTVVMRFEADTQDALQHIQQDFRQVLLQQNAQFSLPF